MFFGIALAGAVSVAVAVFLDFYHAQLYSQLKDVAFTVEGQVSYSFSNSAPITAANSLVYVQYLGFALILLGLVWAAKGKLAKKRSYSFWLTPPKKTPNIQSKTHWGTAVFGFVEKL